MHTYKQRTQNSANKDLTKPQSIVNKLKTSCARGDTICPIAPAPLLSPWAPKRLTRRRADAT